ncbi:MAG: TolC family protein [Acidobacteriota bacterium]
MWPWLLLAWLGAATPDPALSLIRAAATHAPDIAVTRAQARVFGTRIEQARALDDPTAQLSVFPLPPETRAGAQLLGVGVSQRFPWPGVRDLRAEVARADADAAALDVDTVIARVIHDARRLAHEVVYLDAYKVILDEEREHLIRHEESAEARYVAGNGLAQAMIKIQAEISRIDAERLDIETRRAAYWARLVELTGSEPEVDLSLLPDGAALPFLRTGVMWQPSAIASRGVLRDRALTERPALVAKRARLAAAEHRVVLAEQVRRPDLTAGLRYTFVEPRDDVATPPRDDGDDVLALTLGVTLPVWKEKNQARLLEAEAEVAAARAALAREQAVLDRELDDLLERMPRLERQLTLYRDVLLVQAEEALASAEAAYATGAIGALDLLDSEHVLFEVRAAALRTVTDLAHARAALDHTIGRRWDHPSPRPAP